MTRNPPTHFIRPSGYVVHPKMPSPNQLRAQFIKSAVPMVGFGFMDQTIMLQAGNAIDCTLGVTLGISTLTAAALGQIVSNMGSIIFGDGVERAASAMGLSSPYFTLEQSKLPIVRKTQMSGSLVGVLVGCTLGLVNLFFIDPNRSGELKMQATFVEQPPAYEVNVSNSEHSNTTNITVKGADKIGLLASISEVLSRQGYSIVEVVAKTLPREDTHNAMIEDVFVVQYAGTNSEVEEDKLSDLAQEILKAVTV